ncbi:MAG: hypothetical protein H6852_10825 [Geminicoccaceae bacterium]|nr:hypothetical protein [Geminicoccaceae bacterium]HRY25142.1 hypothetical protein [Geminicoccaceae bacterium]
MTLATESAANRPPATTSTVFAAEPRGSYVDWGAVIAGAVVAAALSLVLLTFGSALGLGLTSLEPGEGVSPLWLAIAAAIWLLWVQVSSFMAGGYLAGRLRRPIGDAEPDEVDLRDGSHGLLVWGTGTLVGGLMLTSGLLGAVQTTAQATSNVAGAAVQAAGSAADEGASFAGYLTDTLFRDAATGNSAQARSQARSEAGRIVSQALIDGEIPADDRARLVEIVAEQTGTEPAQVEARVATLEQRLQQQAEDAVEAAETARRWGVIAAFIAAATMLVSAAGAYWAATMGGSHRDSGLLTPFWRRTR